MNIYICIYIYLINSNGGNCQTLCPSPAEAWEPSPGLKWISQSRMLWVQALSELQMAVGHFMEHFVMQVSRVYLGSTT